MKFDTKFDTGDTVKINIPRSIKKFFVIKGNTYNKIHYKIAINEKEMRYRANVVGLAFSDRGILSCRALLVEKL